MRGASHAGVVSVPRTGAWRRARRALRATDWWYFSLLPLVSLVDGSGRADGIVVRLLGSVVAAACCLAYAYGYNGITDRGMDRDQGKNALAGIDAFPREAAVLVTACALTALAIAAALTRVALLGVALSLLAGTLYSGHLRLKRLPVVGTLVNVLIFVPFPLLALVGPPSPAMFLLIYCFYVLVTQNQILHEVGDSEEDIAAGVRTTGVVVGVTGVRVIAVVLGPLAALVLWRWLGTASWSSTAAAVALCGGAVLVAQGDVDRAAGLRVTHRWYSVVAGGILFAFVAWGGA